MKLCQQKIDLEMRRKNLQKEVPEPPGLVGDDLAVLKSTFQTIDQVITSHPWRLRQRPTWFKRLSLACGGCDSSRLEAGVWGGGEAAQEKV